MAKLDFRTFNRPVLELTMVDEAETVITVTSPSEGLVEELEAMLPELESIYSSGDKAAIDAIYDLAARLISCNKEDLQVSAGDLRGKYWPKAPVDNMLYAIGFYSAYMDFIGEINHAKN